jgi:hypothetical protein
MAILRLLVAILVGVVACASESAAPPVALKAVSDADNAILAVVPASDLRINARMPPAIELTAGGVLRLARGRVSRDSSYFVEPPWEVRPLGIPIRGSLRVSFCRVNETVCQTVMLPVNLQE